MSGQNKRVLFIHICLFAGVYALFGVQALKISVGVMALVQIVMQMSSE